MKADAVAPDKREAWVTKPGAQGVDVLLCHPRPVQTELDLIELPSDLPGSRPTSRSAPCVMRQVSRRWWRIGQTGPTVRSC